MIGTLKQAEGFVLTTARKASPVFFSSKKVLGLDIGASSIKLVELDVSKNAAQIVNFGMVPTPPGSVNGGDLVNLPAVSQTLQSLLLQTQVKRKNAASALCGTAVIVKKITIPKVDRKMLDQQIRFEAEQYIPFDLNEISLAYHVLPRSQQPDALDVILVAAQNALVNQYTGLFVQAGFQMSILDIASFALANIFEFNYGKQKNQTIALLNVGASITNFVVLNEGEIVFSRDLPLGGAQYTNEISKELGISFSEAESFKLGASARKEIPPEVNTVIGNTNEILTDEIRNSFDFFSASMSGLSIQQCFCTGGGSLTPQLTTQVSAATQIPFQSLNPFLKVKPSKSMNQSSLHHLSAYSSIALGLGLRKVGDR